MIKRLLPSPLLTLTVSGFWLLLVGNVGPAALLMAVLLGICMPLFAARLDREFARIGSLRLLPKMIVVVGYDIVRSNIEVALRILGPESAIKPGFIWVPLDIRNIHGIAALTSIITLTPGTVSAELSPDRDYLLVHCFHVEDPDAVIADIKQRYEKPLMEIFP